jgi:hypothetical protein
MDKEEDGVAMQTLTSVLTERRGEVSGNFDYTTLPEGEEEDAGSKKMEDPMSPDLVSDLEPDICDTPPQDIMPDIIL